MKQYRINLTPFIIGLGIYFLLRALGIGFYAAAAAAVLSPFVFLLLLSILSGLLTLFERTMMATRIDRYLLARQNRKRKKRLAALKRRRDELVAKRKSERG